MKGYCIEIKWAFIFIAMFQFWMLPEKLQGLQSMHIDRHCYFTNIPAIAIMVRALKKKKTIMAVK